MSRRPPTGPWEVATTVPEGDLQDPGQLAVAQRDLRDGRRGRRATTTGSTFAAVAGYTGMMIAWGCAVWGTGWYYPPYVGYGGFYPVYYPYYPHLRRTRAWYNPWTGAYGRSAVGVRPVRRRRRGRALQPAHGHVRARRGGVRPVRRARRGQAYNPRTGTVRARRVRARTSTAAGARRSVQRGDDWAQTARVTNRRDRHDDARDAHRQRRRRQPQRARAAAASSRSNGDNVYAGQRRQRLQEDDGGSWQKRRQRRTGTIVDRPDAVTSGHSIATAPRAPKAPRARSDYGNYQRSGGGSAGSYRRRRLPRRRRARRRRRR